MISDEEHVFSLGGDEAACAYARGIYLLELASAYGKVRAVVSSRGVFARREWLDGFQVIGLDQGGPKRNSTEEALRLAAGSEMCCGRPMYRHGGWQRPGRWRCKDCGRMVNRQKLSPEEFRKKLARPREGSRFCRRGGQR